MKLPFWKHDSLTIVAEHDGKEIVEIIKFTRPVTMAEVTSVKWAWEAGFARGLAAASNRDSEPS